MSRICQGKKSKIRFELAPGSSLDRFGSFAANFERNEHYNKQGRKNDSSFICQNKKFKNKERNAFVSHIHSTVVIVKDVINERNYFQLS